MRKAQLLQKVKRSAPTILTFVGVAGVGITSVLTAKATVKATRILDEVKEIKGEELTEMEVVKTVAPLYIPATLAGISTVTCILGANVLNKRAQATLMSVYALLDSSYREYKGKTLELYGKEAHEHISAELAKDKYKEGENPDEGDGKRLYYDEYSERYFRATTEDVIKAEYEVNRIINEYSGLFLNEYYTMLGIPEVDFGDFVGWSAGQMIDMYWESWVHFEHQKVELEDGMECTIIRYTDPLPDFDEY